MDLAADRDWISGKLEIGRELLYLSREDVENIDLTEQDILDLIREALVAHGQKRYEMPAKVGVHPLGEVFFHAMPAYVPGNKAVGLKWIECYPSNPARFNLPQTTGLLVINDVLSGCPLVVMDATVVTAVRTPAVTVLAAAALHRDAETFGMFGCGVQGMEHCRYIVRVLEKLQRIYVYDIRTEAADELIHKVQPHLDVEIIRAGSPEEVVKNCQVMSSATVILPEPLAVVKDDWVSAGQTILPCDLNTFWDPAIPRRADRYIVDSIDEHKLFDGMGYFPQGLPRISCETGEVLAGLAPGREGKDELIVCSNIGIAVCDVVLGREMFNRALEGGLGRRLPL